MRNPPRRQAGRPVGGLRALRLEPLEDRSLLSAGELVAEPAVDEFPWQNPVYRLDVNNDGQTTPTDALILINRILAGGVGDLPDPGPNGPPFFYDTSGDNRLTAADLARVINGILAPPSVTISSLTPSTIDVTPLITVNVTGNAPVPDGTVVLLDVDLNNDGDFSDPGELGYTQSTTYAGSSTFAITPALPRSDELYSVNLRARLKNADAVPGASPLYPLQVDTLTSNALSNYVNAPDPSYTYSQVSATPTPFGFTYYVLDMTSQTWRSAADVNIPVWRHYLAVYVPNGAVSSTALMLIDGGNNTSGPPAMDVNFGGLAVALNSVFVTLKTVPNEPVVFTDETRSRTEDAIIAYTFDKYLRNIGAEGNETWPLLLPMVKSAVRTMDTIQDFLPAVQDFFVTGYSKRGWTTWLTAAVDDRVRAIIPGVFDNLNQGPSMVHHYGVYGFFSEAVDDYEEIEIFTRLLTPESQLLSQITDPYRYLTNGKFDDLPKLIMVSPGDEFFVTDSAQFYIDDIPGDQNYLRYIPNTGHGLDLGEVVNSTVSFYDAVVNNRALPTYSWTVAQDGSIHVHTPSNPTSVRLWQATNPNARDFRRLATPGINWTPTTLSNLGGGNYLGDVVMPPQGATAYFVELTFANPVPSLPAFVFTTEARVKSTLPFAPWPFEAGPLDSLEVAALLEVGDMAQAMGAAFAEMRGSIAAPGVVGEGAKMAVAMALSIVEPADEPRFEAATSGTLPLVAEADAKPARVDGGTLANSAAAGESPDDAAMAEAVDDLLGTALDELLA